MKDINKWLSCIRWGMKHATPVSLIISLIDTQFELCPFNGILMG
jgi:hypothetical protein